MKKWRLNRVLFWMGLAGSAGAALLACDPHNILCGISLGIAALGFLKASEIASKDNVKIDVPLALYTKKEHLTDSTAP